MTGDFRDDYRIVRFERESLRWIESMRINYPLA